MVAGLSGLPAKCTENDEEPDFEMKPAANSDVMSAISICSRPPLEGGDCSTAGREAASCPASERVGRSTL